MAITNLKRIYCLTFLLLSCVVGQARAEDNIMVSQNWCADGSFQTTIERIGASLNDPENSCISLTGSTMSSRDAIKLSKKHLKPVGNSVAFILNEVLNNNSVTFKDLKMPQMKEYVVKAGRCLNVQFFVVEDVRRASFPALYSENESLALSQCLFDKSTQEIVQSEVDLSGVYERTTETSVRQFISTQFQR